jgi:hypothetical protein
MLKKYLKEILICFALIVGFGCGWYGCKSYMRYQVNQMFDQLEKELDKTLPEDCNSITNSIENDTTMNDTILDCNL